jgi:hypothetical protein
MLISEGFQKLISHKVPQQNCISPPQLLCSSGMRPGGRLGCECQRRSLQKCIFPLSQVTWTKITILIGGSRCKTSMLFLPVCHVFISYLSERVCFMAHPFLAERIKEKVQRAALCTCTKCGAFLIGLLLVYEARLHVVRTAMCDVNRVINHKTRVKICWARLSAAAHNQRCCLATGCRHQKNAIYEKFSLSLL